MASRMTEDGEGGIQEVGLRQLLHRKGVARRVNIFYFIHAVWHCFEKYALVSQSFKVLKPVNVAPRPPCPFLFSFPARVSSTVVPWLSSFLPFPSVRRTPPSTVSST